MLAAGRLLIGLALAATAAQLSTPVRLDVSAIDGEGHRIGDLLASEVSVRDDGKPQEIKIFLRRRVRAKAPPNVTVIVLNGLDLAVRKQQWDETIRTIQRFEAADDVYLYVMRPPSGVLLPIRGLPATEDEASASLSSWTSRILPQFENVPNLYSGPAMPAGTRPPLPFDYVGPAYTAADALVAQMAKLPGRKSLVWVGAQPLFTRASDWGGSTQAHQMADQMFRLVSALETADIGVYTVQPSLDHVERSVDPLILRDNGFIPIQPRLAAATGGVEYRDNIGVAIARAIVDEHDGYRIFYDPPPGSKYHKVAVTTTRPGVSAHSEQGYDPTLYQEPLEARRREVMDLMAGSFRDAPDIGLTAKCTRTGSRVVHFEVRADANDVAPLSNSEFTIGLLEYSEDGRKQWAGDPIHIAVKLAPQDQAAALKDGLPFAFDMPVTPGVRKVRLVVCDDRTLLTGSATMTLQEGR